MSSVVSRLDYCNAIFAGISSEQTLSLRRILNHSFRLVTKRSKRNHITPNSRSCTGYLCSFGLSTNWQPWHTFTLTGHSPSTVPFFLSLYLYEPSCALRSSQEKRLELPECSLKTFGKRSFSFLARTVWNSLPSDLRNAPSLASSKKQVKTSLSLSVFVTLIVFSVDFLTCVFSIFFPQWQFVNVHVHCCTRACVYVFVIKHSLTEGCGRGGRKEGWNMKY